MNAVLKPAANAAARHKGDYAQNPHDWYVEEPHAVYALLDVLGPMTRASILDPCAGLGTVPACIRAYREKKGHRNCASVTASDIAQRDIPGVDGGIDFFACPRFDEEFIGAPPYREREFDWVISNPPYFGGKGPVEFFHRAVPIARFGVAMLVNLPFLASQGRNALFNDNRPCALVFLSRRPSMPPGQELREGKVKQRGGKEDYLWIVWAFGLPNSGAHWPPPRHDYPPPDFPPGVFLTGRD